MYLLAHYLRLPFYLPNFLDIYNISLTITLISYPISPTTGDDEDEDRDREGDSTESMDLERIQNLESNEDVMMYSCTLLLKYGADAGK